MSDCQVKCVVRSDFSPPRSRLWISPWAHIVKTWHAEASCQVPPAHPSSRQAPWQEGGQGGFPQSFCMDIFDQAKATVMHNTKSDEYKYTPLPCLQSLLSS